MNPESLHCLSRSLHEYMVPPKHDDNNPTVLLCSEIVREKPGPDKYYRQIYNIIHNLSLNLNEKFGIYEF